MRITPKDLTTLQACANSLEAYAMELKASGIQSYIKHSKEVIRRAIYLDKFVAKLIMRKR